MSWTQEKEIRDKVSNLEIDVHSLHGKTVIIRVPDPDAYGKGVGAYTSKFLKGAGAASVIVCKPDDKIEVLSDEDLAKLGLKRIE